MEFITALFTAMGNATTLIFAFISTAANSIVALIYIDDSITILGWIFITTLSFTLVSIIFEAITSIGRKKE